MIIVTGAARSGTSLTTRILQAHGCHLGSTVNGLYENTDVRDGVVKRYLRSIGADPLGQSILPDTDNLAYVPGWRKTVERHFRAFPKPWAYKCAKATLIWPVWHEAFPDAKWIIVRRNKRSIAASCLRSGFMCHYRDIAGWEWWVEEHEKRFDAMKAAGLDIVEVWPRDYIAAPEAFRPVADHCGLEFRPEHVTKAIDRNLYRDA